MKQSLQSGLLITIEGIDGSGKSTLAKNLTTYLQHEYETVLTKEPGGSALGKQLRTLLQTQPVPITPLAEYLLFAADRAQHFHEVIIPNLKKGNIIISDRMADSSIVYQGYGRGLDREKIKYVNQWAMQGIQPDITFYVRITPQQAMERIQQRNIHLTVFEQEQKEFTERLVTGFDTIFATRTNVITLDGMHTPEQLTEQAFITVQSWIKKQLP